MFNTQGYPIFKVTNDKRDHYYNKQILTCIIATLLTSQQ